MTGKGSKQRPRMVERARFEDNWDAVFRPSRLTGTFYDGATRVLPSILGDSGEKGEMARAALRLAFQAQCGDPKSNAIGRVLDVLSERDEPPKPMR